MISAISFGFCNPTLQSQTDKPHKIQIHAHLPLRLQFLSFKPSMTSLHTVHQVKPRLRNHSVNSVSPLFGFGALPVMNLTPILSLKQRRDICTHMNSKLCSQDIFYSFVHLWLFTPIHTKAKTASAMLSKIVVQIYLLYYRFNLEKMFYTVIHSHCGKFK